jgi:hypothetical protein
MLAVMNTHDATPTTLVTVGTRSSLGPLAETITAWRTARYVDAGFYDESLLQGLSVAGGSPETSMPGDYEVVAWAGEGRPLATVTLRSHHDSFRFLGDRRRPAFAFEAVHGRAWLPAAVPGARRVPVNQVWELGRFLRDRSVACPEAIPRVIAAVAGLVRRLRDEGRLRLVAGEVEPSVALNHLVASGVPLTLGPERSSPPVEGLLAPRYVGRRLVPFVIDVARIRTKVLTELEHGRAVAA